MMIDLYEPSMSERGLLIRLRSTGGNGNIGGCGVAAPNDSQLV